MDYERVIEELCDAALHSEKTVETTKFITGKELVGCFPIKTPEEIVYAAGCIPVGMWGGRTDISLADRYLQSFCCSIMRTNLEFAMRGIYQDLKAVIIPTFCDTMKCMVENWKLALPDIPTIALAYPQNRRLKVGIDYTVSELKRVRHELEVALGRLITTEAIEQAFAVYEEYRHTMRRFVLAAAKHPQIITCKRRHLIIKAGEFMDKACYMDKVNAVIAGLEQEHVYEYKGIKVVATGILPEPVEILELFDENNIAIVGDDFALGSRKWRTESRDDIEDVFLKMAMTVADQEGDTFFYDPDKKKGQMIIESIRNNKADAAVVMMMKFCDPEEYDYPILREELIKE